MTAAPTLPRQHLDDGWTLFADWCAATGRSPLPTNRDAVEQFFTDIPAAPSTQVMRVRAIRVAHEAAGHLPPLPAPQRPDPQTATRTGDGWVPLHTAIRRCPSYGARGALGRRDAWILVLLGTLRFTRHQVRHLLPRDVNTYQWTVRDRALPTDPDRRGCPRCVTVRWLNLLAAASRGFRADVQAVVHEPRPEGHDCAQPVNPAWRDCTPLLLTFDRHGWFTHTSLSNRTLSAIVTARHRDTGEPLASEQGDWSPLWRSDPAATERARDELDDLLGVLDEMTQKASKAVDRARWAAEADIDTIRQWSAQGS